MDWAAGALVLMRYRWKDRHDDLVNHNRRNPWPLRIEAVLLGGLMLLSFGAAVWSVIAPIF